MDSVIFKSISGVFHPLIMPMLGVVFYFSKTPRYIPEPIIKAKLFSVIILTIVLPILSFFLLRTIKKVETFDLKQAKERILPLLINCIIISLILFRVMPIDDISELFFFFLGILLSTVVCLVFVLFKIKASIHMIAASGFCMFAIAIGIHYQININGSIALMAIILGAVASSRLHLKAHTPLELVLGLLIGLIPQTLFLGYWL